MSDYFDLGTYSRPVSTDSPEAQLWFDRGLNWGYGYNYEEYALARIIIKRGGHLVRCPESTGGAVEAGGA
jgi:hypothetical protein